MKRAGWTQPLCEPCYVALEERLGAHDVTHAYGDPVKDGRPCLVCGTPTLISIRIVAPSTVSR